MFYCVKGIMRWLARVTQNQLIHQFTRVCTPCKVDEARWQRVGEPLKQEPNKLNDDFTIWISERPVTHLVKETGVELSINRFRIVMRQ